jgi:preprotein translocase subunit SecA
MLAETLGKAGEELCSVSLKYGKKSWKAFEESSGPVYLKAVRTAIEDQIPDFYERLHKRHLKLKGIYAHCKKRNFAPKQPIQVPKVGRNDPCPCGSGKKYKKCCLR